MAITVYYESEGQRIPHFIGLAGDVKPTIASHSGVESPAPGSKFLEYDTPAWYITRELHN